ncbi:MAG: hypothetical protein F4179_04340 [Gammaproteobacteria bacterium]|nr:hypothetical protein [Gammaproteobacteria bacterium]MYF60892.1 hypothetical protein [Gammaproteobacteria bacterium]MYI21254.1 hypothetical protein [Gammaproteobacteria bacterium]
MVPIISALLAPLAGVLIYVTMHHRARTVRLLDTAVIVALPLLVAAQVVPHAWAERSFVPVVVVALGAGLVAMVERLSRTLARYTDDATIVFAVLGISVHALVEGSALTAGASPAFVLAVVAHRVTLGLLIWWLVVPRHGTRAAAAGVAAILAATVAGYVVGTGVMADLPFVDSHLLEAFVAGTLLHVVLHQGREDHRH